MSIRFRINQYVGVNAHLMSYYQRHGGWSGFHSKYMTGLSVVLDPLLQRRRISTTGRFC